MFHILPGDAARDQLKTAGIPGSLVVWGDILHLGPLPSDATPEHWRTIRAAFYDSCQWGSYHENLALLSAWDDGLTSALNSEDELVLWADVDLVDQLQIAHHLDLIAQSNPARVAHFAALPSGKLQLSPSDLVTAIKAAFEQREPLDAEDLAFGARVWNALVDTDPADLVRIVHEHPTPLPDLQAAIRRFLQDYPWSSDGLSLSERRLLQSLDALSGAADALALFHAAAEREDAPFWADAGVAWMLSTLAREPHPLVRVSPAVPTTVLKGLAIELTHTGRDVLESSADALALRGINRWMGGVHLHGAHHSPWLWHEPTARLVAPA